MGVFQRNGQPDLGMFQFLRVCSALLRQETTCNTDVIDVGKKLANRLSDLGLFQSLRVCPIWLRPEQTVILDVSVFDEKCINMPLTNVLLTLDAMFVLIVEIIKTDSAEVIKDRNVTK